MFIETEKPIFKKTILLMVLFICSASGVVEAASPKRDIKEGNKHYRGGDFTASRENYMDALKKDPESDIVNFNLGTALYKEKEYEQSVNYLQKALLSENEQLKENAHYNLGNALYRSGMAQADKDINVAVSSLEKSLGQYERAMSLDAKDQDAKHNYDFVKKELMRLKERQKQQQQENQEQQKQKNQQDQEKKGQQQEQRGQQGEQQKQEQQGQQQKQQQGQQEQQQQGEKQEQQSGQQQQEENNKEQQGQSGQEKAQQQEQKEKQSQGSGQEGQEDYNNQQTSNASPQDASELTQKEAQMMLESYQQSEEPQGLLNVVPRMQGTEPVFKDW